MEYFYLFLLHEKNAERSKILARYRSEK